MTRLTIGTSASNSVNLVHDTAEVGSFSKAVYSVSGFTVLRFSTSAFSILGIFNLGIFRPGINFHSSCSIQPTAFARTGFFFSILRAMRPHQAAIDHETVNSRGEDRGFCTVLTGSPLAYSNSELRSAQICSKNAFMHSSQQFARISA